MFISDEFPGGSDGKASAYNVGDLGLIPGSGRSSGEGEDSNEPKNKRLGAGVSLLLH